MKKEKLSIGGQLAKIRWSKTTKEQRMAHSKKMTKALKEKRNLTKPLSTVLIDKPLA